MSKKPNLPEFVTREVVANSLLLGPRRLDRLVKAGETEKVKISGSRSGITLGSLQRYIWRRRRSRPYYSSIWHAHFLDLPYEDAKAGYAAGLAIDKYLTEKFPGCSVTVKGKRIIVFVPASTGHDNDAINEELAKFVSDE
jgi:hypothetical protein